MTDDVVRWAGESTRPDWRMDVQPCGGEHEHAQQSKKGHAVQLASQPSGGEERRISGSQDVSPAPDAHNAAAADGRLEPSPTETQLLGGHPFVSVHTESIRARATARRSKWDDGGVAVRLQSCGEAGAGSWSSPRSNSSEAVSQLARCALSAS
ncbi:hypothetical protein GCM10027071_08950 [Microbacterium marinum]